MLAVGVRLRKARPSGSDAARNNGRATRNTYGATSRRSAHTSWCYCVYLGGIFGPDHTPHAGHLSARPSRGRDPHSDWSPMTGTGADRVTNGWCENNPMARTTPRQRLGACGLRQGTMGRGSLASAPQGLGALHGTLHSVFEPALAGPARARPTRNLRSPARMWAGGPEGQGGEWTRVQDLLLAGITMCRLQLSFLLLGGWAWLCWPCLAGLAKRRKGKPTSPMRIAVLSGGEGASVTSTTYTLTVGLTIMAYLTHFLLLLQDPHLPAPLGSLLTVTSSRPATTTLSCSPRIQVGLKPTRPNVNACPGPHRPCRRVLQRWRPRPRARRRPCR